MASSRKETNFNDPWSIANALVGLFTFRVPRQTSNLSDLSGSSIQRNFKASIGRAGKDVCMKDIRDERQDSGGSSSPIDQPPPSVSEHSQMSPSQSLPTINEESVISWAMKKVESGAPVNQLELLGLQNFLQNRHEPAAAGAREETIEPEVLDLTGSATPTPGPSRAESRNGPSFTTSSSLPSIVDGAKPRKMLQKNPNGKLHWRGAGSARVRPGSKPRVVRPVSGPSERREDRVKRRRLAEMDDSENQKGSVSSASEPAISSMGNTSGASVQTGSSDVHKTPRANVRTGATPPIPSPLRQVTSNNTSPDSRASVRGHNVAQQRTHAAAVLSEIIESVTPPPKMTIANPYQNEAPVKPDYKPKPVKRVAERREELARKEKEKEREKEQVLANEKKDYSAKSIIEATVPKGARRSRPSLTGNKSQTLGDVNGRNDKTNEEASTKKRHRVTVEDADDEECDARREARSEEVPPQKKTKVTVETVNDDDGETPINSSRSSDESRGVRATSPSVPKPPSIFGVPKHSAKPREPSKLRTSIVAEDDDHTSGGPPYPSVLASVPPAAAAVFAKRSAETKATSTPQPVEPPVAQKISAFPMPGQKPGTSLPTVIEEKAASSGAAMDIDTAESIALRKSKDSLPKYHFDVTVSVFDPKYASAQKAALAKKPSELPQYDFNKPLTNGISNATVSKSNDAKPTPIPAPASVAPPKEPVQAFNWALAGVKPQKAEASGGTWTCGTCMLSNPASATEKCTICETPR